MKKTIERRISIDIGLNGRDVLVGYDSEGDEFFFSYDQEEDISLKLEEIGELRDACDAVIKFREEEQQ